jgi:hypothetical protein
MDPGSAAHRFALRSVRGTPNIQSSWFETALKQRLVTMRR